MAKKPVMLRVYGKDRPKECTFSFFGPGRRTISSDLTNQAFVVPPRLRGRPQPTSTRHFPV